MSNVSEKTAFVIFERFGFKGESIFNSIDILAIRRLVSSALHVLLQISKKRQFKKKILKRECTSKSTINYPRQQIKI
jgi:uncharacterized membrane protein